MPVVTVNVPEPKADPLLRELLKEFRQVADSLRGLKTSNGESKVLSMVSRQQEVLLRAIERMMQMVSTMSKRSSAPRPAMEMKGIKSALTSFASDLKDALKSSYRTNGTVHPRVTVKPNITISMNGLGKRMDRLEYALTRMPQRVRNRTFGSNY